MADYNQLDDLKNQLESQLKLANNENRRLADEIQCQDEKHKANRVMTETKDCGVRLNPLPNEWGSFMRKNGLNVIRNQNQKIIAMVNKQFIIVRDGIVNLI